MNSLFSARNLLLAAAISVSALADHSAVTPVAKPDQGWKTRAELLNQRIKDNPDAQLLFIGDSITHGWENAGAKEIWEKYYGKRKAVNIGIGGDRTQHVLYRLQHGNLDGVKPKAAVVMIGTNNSNGEDNTVEQIVDGIKAIVKELRTREPQMKVLLLGIFPRGENPNPQRGKIAQVNQIIQKLDDGKNIVYLDIGHRFLDDDGHLSATIMPDYLHPNTKGYEIWAEAIEPKLAELLGDQPIK
jgi:lysophospholipase L1-like esterase